LTDGRWIDLAEGVYARRYSELDLTVGLVLGATGCLVVDTRGDIGQGTELAAAVRKITDLPWSVVCTHAHFDHCFGTTAFLPCEVWGHEAVVTELTTDGERARRQWAKSYREEGKTTIAEDLDRTTIELPDRLFTGEAVINLGGRDVVLRHLGKAHTDHDVLVHVPDAGVLFAGDVVENATTGFSADSFGEDNDLGSWPGVLTAIEALGAPIVVPGHGDPVDVAFVAAERAKLTELICLHLRVGSGELSEHDAVARSPYPANVTLASLKAAGVRQGKFRV
jgi:glyoxylase-like metal-dependent hydrolase (beta-lactamase superfamily II)